MQSHSGPPGTLDLEIFLAPIVRRSLSFMCRYCVVDDIKLILCQYGFICYISNFLKQLKSFDFKSSLSLLLKETWQYFEVS